MRSSGADLTRAYTPLVTLPAAHVNATGCGLPVLRDQAIVRYLKSGGSGSHGLHKIAAQATQRMSWQLGCGGRERRSRGPWLPWGAGGGETCGGCRL